MITREFVKNVEKDTDYDYISNNYYNMSKEDLRDAYKELSYAVFEFLSPSDYAKFKENFVSALLWRMVDELSEED